MPRTYEIPLTGAPQRFSIPLPIEGSPTNNATAYTLTFQYRDADPAVAGGCGWTLDLADQGGTPILCGVPLVTGADLLAQYDYLALGGHLIVSSEGEPLAIPTFDNLGSGSHLYWVTLP
jgi:Domain of unknown function (DUF6983)